MLPRQAIHAHDILSFVNGPVTSVSARLATRVNAIEVEDCAVVALEMADGSAGGALGHARLRRGAVTAALHFENLTAENRRPTYRPGKDPWHFKASNEDADRRIAAALRDFQPSAERSRANSRTSMRPSSTGRRHPSRWARPVPRWS